MSTIGHLVVVFWACALCAYESLALQVVGVQQVPRRMNRDSLLALVIHADAGPAAHILGPFGIAISIGFILVAFILFSFFATWLLPASKETAQTSGESGSPSLTLSAKLVLCVLPSVTWLLCLGMAIAWFHFNPAVARDELMPILMWTAIQIGVKQSLRIVAACAKYPWLRWLGLSHDQALRTFLPIPVDPEWLAVAGDDRIMICDGVVRKGLIHILHSLLTYVSFSYMPLTLVVPVFALQYLCMIAVDAAFFTSEGPIATYGVYGGGLRIRDGYLKRWNWLQVFGSGALAELSVTVCWQALTPSVPASVHAVLLIILLCPLQVGDAMAEFVGVTLGYHRFPVYGMGERNDKSVEGCVGMWLSVVVVIITALYLHGLPTAPWWILVLSIASTTTAAETLTPRGFDNLTITGFACFCLAVALAAGWSPYS